LSKERIVDILELKEFCISAFSKLGVPKEEAEITSDVLVRADLRGIESHGVARLSRYIRRLKLNQMRAAAKLTVVKETPSTLLVDGENSLGQVVSYRVMEKCIAKAQSNGTCLATVKNSNHFGIAGYYAMMASDKNMMGISSTNAWPLVVPTFGREPLLGTNPISVAVPVARQPPFVLDMATSVVPIGKIEVYNRRGEPVPLGMAVDGKGRPTTSAKDILRAVYDLKKGGLMPLGGLEETAGYKGYGLAVLVDILCAILSGASYGPNVGNPQDPKPSDIGHFFGAVDIESFRPLNEFKEYMGKMTDSLRNSEKAEGQSRIYLAGEKEHEMEEERRKNGIPLYYKVYESLAEVARDVGVEFNL